jgi:hypothetical protein
MSMIQIDGEAYTRIPAGSGKGHDAGDCFECGAATGELHADGCDVERCPCCGGQLVRCTRFSVGPCTGRPGLKVMR